MRAQEFSLTTCFMLNTFPQRRDRENWSANFIFWLFDRSFIYRSAPWVSFFFFYSYSQTYAFKEQKGFMYVVLKYTTTALPVITNWLWDGDLSLKHTAFKCGTFELWQSTFTRFDTSRIFIINEEQVQVSLSSVSGSDKMLAQILYGINICKWFLCTG